MREGTLALALVALALAGCLGAQPVQPAERPEPEPAPLDDDFQPPPPRRVDPPPAPPSTPPPPPPPLPDPGPLAVIAHVDTGINPYHMTFRDPGPLAFRHPSTYLPGFPADAPALELSLGASSYGDALQRDRAVWDGVERGKLYWIPGTRIVGAISFGEGGTQCPDDLAPRPPPPLPPVVPPAPVCLDLPIVDDHGHGTMTASRMAAGQHSLCPSCRIVSIEGLGAAGVRWAAEQGWVDVQTNSWGSLYPATVPSAVQAITPAGNLTVGNEDIREAFAFAAQRMLVFAASGNGIAFRGGVGEPRPQQATAAAGVVDVGAHDNGRVTLYHGQPPHVVADGYGGFRAHARDLYDLSASNESCCTSAASPYAAGGAAAALLEARRFLDHRGTGFPQGVGAKGALKATGGPLDDGQLTLDEMRRLVLASATPRPAPDNEDDGLVHCSTRPTAQGCSAGADPGRNPYCPACWTLPVNWTDIPDDGPAYHLLGYGAIDPVSVALAGSILRGEVQAPARTAEDALYLADQRARAALDGTP